MNDAAEHSGPFAGAHEHQLLDGGRLLAWLDEHAQVGSLIRRSIYEGEAARIRRGDFNAGTHS